MSINSEETAHCMRLDESWWHWVGGRSGRRGVARAVWQRPVGAPPQPLHSPFSGNSITPSNRALLSAPRRVFACSITLPASTCAGVHHRRPPDHSAHDSLSLGTGSCQRGAAAPSTRPFRPERRRDGRVEVLLKNKKVLLVRCTQPARPHARSCLQYKGPAPESDARSEVSPVGHCQLPRPLLLPHVAGTRAAAAPQGRGRCKGPFPSAQQCPPLTPCPARRLWRCLPRSLWPSATASESRRPPT